MYLHIHVYIYSINIHNIYVYQYKNYIFMCEFICEYMHMYMQYCPHTLNRTRTIFLGLCIYMVTYILLIAL